MNVKYIVTLHGLIGVDKFISASDWDKEYEKNFILKSDATQTPVTVISTGIKKRIEKYYLKKSSSNIIVINNGFRFEHVNINCLNLREYYKIPETAKIAIVVGSIYNNKNQIQVVDAMKILLDRGIKNIYTFFCGMDFTNGELQKKINELGLDSRIFVLGFIQHEKMNSIYRQADFNVVASFNEGFGMSIIEAFYNGLPTVTFSDIDALLDIYDEKAMLLCKTRDTFDFAKTIFKMSELQWDRDWIKKYSNKFSIENTTNSYIKLYYDFSV